MKYGKILVTLTLVAAANSLAFYYGPRGGTFSPDGSKVAYLFNEASWDIMNYRIYTVNADGSAKVRFDLPGGIWGEPYFSPDGSKIAFVTDYRYFPNGNVFLVDVDGTNLTQVTTYGDGAAEIPDGPRRNVGAVGRELTFSPDGRKVLYISREFGSGDIFAINVDGTGKTRLTDLADYEESGPVFLAGGDEIIFTVRGSGRKAEVWIMNADGSAKRKLAIGENVKLAALSPDGKKMAYDEESGLDYRSNEFSCITYVADLDGSGRFEVAEKTYPGDGPAKGVYLTFSRDGKKVLYLQDDSVFVVNADGSGRKALTPTWDYVESAVFFADGAKIAFAGRRYRHPCPPNIYTMDADGANLEVSIATEGMLAWGLVVSAAGDRFLFKGDYYGGLYNDYFVVNADGTGLARLTTWYAEYNPYGGKFSADGSKIAYLSNETGEYHIYTVNADGTGKVKLELEGGLWGEPYLSPDGKKVAFVNYYEFFQKGNIFLADADGRNLTKVTAYGDDAVEIPDGTGRSAGVLYKGLTFSPDGRKLLYLSDEFGSWDIFAVNVDGTGKTRLTDFAEYDESGPAFPAGGDKILFTVSDGEEKSEVWIMNADGSGKKKVPVPGNAELTATSRDGKKIMLQAWSRCEGPDGITWGTYVADSDGSSPAKIANDPECGISFSPDGKKVVYESATSVYTSNADGSGEKNLTPAFDYAGSPAFFAAGAKIAFVGRYDNYPYPLNIYTMDADGSNQTLFKATEGMHIRSFAVSPTGDRFFFQVYSGPYKRDYFVVNADGSGLKRLTGE
jgi:Tol biopolymer transport system component